MENDHLDLLKTIQKVEVSDSVYRALLHRIQNQKAKIVPLYKVGIAASLMLGLFLGEMLLVAKQNKVSKSTSELHGVLTVNDNSLYHE